MINKGGPDVECPLANAMLAMRDETRLARHTALGSFELDGLLALDA